MKTIGIVGGMSWESTAEYYRRLNTMSKKKFGGLHSAPVLLHSLDFSKIARLQTTHDWKHLAEIMIDSAKRLETAGAECILICSNTMHQVADDVEAALSVPLLHIADATSEKARSLGLHSLGLLGTRYTMEAPFYKERVERNADLHVQIPEEAEREYIHKAIYEELCQGMVTNGSRKHFLKIIDALHASGADGIVLGCTEIGMLITSDDTDIPLLDTARIHTEYAFHWACT